MPGEVGQQPSMEFDRVQKDRRPEFWDLKNLGSDA